jgi:hypothetical protein
MTDLERQSVPPLSPQASDLQTKIPERRSFAEYGQKERNLKEQDSMSSPDEEQL